MTIFRFIALIVAVIAGLYVIRHLYRRKLSGFEFTIWFTLVLAVITLSIFPEIIIFVFTYLTLSIINRYDRLIGLSFIFIFLSFSIIFLYRNRLHTYREQFLDIIQITTVRKFIDRYGTEKGTHDLFILIPAFNEEENLREVLNRMPDQICGLTPQVIIISDGSNDNTIKVAEQGGAWTAEHLLNFGGGMALKTGYRIAIDMKPLYVVTLDADGQYQPEEIERLLQPIIDGTADMISGSRTLGYYEQKYLRNHVVRSIGIQFFNIVLTVLTGQKITDSSSGFRAIKAEFLPRLNLIQEQYHSSEFLIECFKNGLRIKEVPISFLTRISGESKKPKSFRYGVGFVQAIIKTWMRR